MKQDKDKVQRRQYFKLRRLTPNQFAASLQGGLNAHVEWLEGDPKYPVIVRNSDWSGNGGGEKIARLDCPTAARKRQGGVDMYELPPGVELREVKGRKTGGALWFGLETLSIKRALQLFGQDAWIGKTPTPHDKFCEFTFEDAGPGFIGPTRSIEETRKDYEDRGFIFHPWKRSLDVYDAFDQACEAFPLGGKWQDFPAELKVRFEAFGSKNFHPEDLEADFEEEDSEEDLLFEEFEETKKEKKNNFRNKTGLCLHLRDVLSRAERRVQQKPSAPLKERESADLTKRRKSPLFCTWAAERTERLIEALSQKS